ncbi:nuclear transport factor 2 family protein [Streptomyces sp. NBC_01764]|uniref:nuclear transport factor 2 family protein n=1 Tax=Streptomyces sp. NBC_01764 TaxID=2975935 RepID=UPI0022574AB2|nr:nuclear transport factor 2 family protein [Streptomyces sp. NBC_01764]MCX4404909.1 nuclear transport factor 2 family protein [Streptomyces sp. NBC_01764]
MRSASGWCANEGLDNPRSRWSEELFAEPTTCSTPASLDGDIACGRAYVSVVGRGLDGRGGLNYAIYHDRYRRTGDGWKFAERVYAVRYEDASPLADSPPRPAEGS